MEDVLNAADAVALEVQLHQGQLRDSRELRYFVVVQVDLEQLLEPFESFQRGDVVAAYLEGKILRSST